WPTPQMSSRSPSISEQRRPPDRGGVDAGLTPRELPAGEKVVLEDRADGLEVELGRQVEHREVLVVERLRRPRAFLVPGDDVVVQAPERRAVALGVHPHERRDLDEAGIDAARQPAARRRAKDGTVL